MCGIAVILVKLGGHIVAGESVRLSEPAAPAGAKACSRVLPSEFNPWASTSTITGGVTSTYGVSNYG
jgi:hypothetical protein